jgi:hypothetical protein
MSREGIRRLGGGKGREGGWEGGDAREGRGGKYQEWERRGRGGSEKTRERIIRKGNKNEGRDDPFCGTSISFCLVLSLLICVSL